MTQERYRKEIKQDSVFAPKALANSFYNQLSPSGFKLYNMNFDVVVEQRYAEGEVTVVTKTVEFQEQDNLGDCKKGFVLLESPDSQDAYLLSFDSISDSREGWTEYIFGISRVPNHTTASDLRQWRQQISNRAITAYHSRNEQPNNSLQMVFFGNDLKFYLEGEDKVLTDFYNSFQGILR